jgi:ABC-2 type transport system permease protein
MTMTALDLPAGPVADERENAAEELRTIGMVWERELIRFFRTRARILSSFVQPILFLFVLGYGMTTLVGTTGGFDFKKFVFPGIVAMTVMSTAISSAISIVWDREFGFLREMLVAPVSRTALVTGKTLGGASVATVQGTIMLALAPSSGCT